MMEAGKLRHKISILKLANSNDPANLNEYGEPKGQWSIFASSRASKEPLLGNEYFRAEAIQSNVEVKFRTRYIPGVNNAMRIQHGNELYEILSAIDVESRNRELLIYAKKVI